MRVIRLKEDKLVIKAIDQSPLGTLNDFDPDYYEEVEMDTLPDGAQFEREYRDPGKLIQDELKALSVEVRARYYEPVARVILAVQYEDYALAWQILENLTVEAPEESDVFIRIKNIVKQIKPKEENPHGQ